MILCRSINDKSSVNAWIRTGPKADVLYKGFEPAKNENGDFEVSVNRCHDFQDFLLSAMAVRASRTEGMKNTPVIIAVAIGEELLAKHGIRHKHTPDNGKTGFSEVDKLHFDLVAGSEESFKNLASHLYLSHTERGNIIHMLNNGCLLRGCKSLLELCDSPDREAANRIRAAAQWLDDMSDSLGSITACPRPRLWDVDPQDKLEDDNA